MLVHVKVSGEKEFICKRDKTTRLILENQDLKGTVSQDMRYSFFFLLMLVSVLLVKLEFSCPSSYRLQERSEKETFRETVLVCSG